MRGKQLEIFQSFENVLILALPVHPNVLFRILSARHVRLYLGSFNSRGNYQGSLKLKKGYLDQIFWFKQLF